MRSGTGDSRAAVYKRGDFLILSAVTLIGMLGITSITPAFPGIVRELNVPAKEVGLLISAYSVPGVVLLPLCGVLGDRIGRRKIIVPSLLLFGAAGTACAFVRDFNLLLVLRLFQGVGAAPLVTLSFVMLCDAFSGAERTSSLFYNSSIIGLGSAAFPIIGGLLATFGWYYPFLMPAAAVPVGLAALSMRGREPRNLQDFGDYLGQVRRSLANLQSLGLFLAFIITPIIVFGAFMNYFPILLEDGLGASAVVAGSMIALLFLVAALTSSRLVRSSGRLSEKRLFGASFLLYAASLALIPLMTNVYLILIPVVILGVAQGFNEPGRRTLMARLAPSEHRSAFTSASDMFYILGEAAGPVLMGAAFGWGGLDVVFYAGAALSLIAVLIIILAIK